MDGNKIDIRLATNGDISGVISLWKNYSEWGEITETQYRNWFINQPYGKAIIIVALDESGEIIGMIVFNPVKIKAGNTIVDAVKVAAPVVKPIGGRLSLFSLDHLVIKIFDFGMTYVKQNGFIVAYATPAKAWHTVIKFISRHIWKDYYNYVFGCFFLDWNIISPERYTKEWDDCTAKIVTHFDHAFDILWNIGAETLPVKCGIVKDSKWLAWKIGGHMVIGFYRNSMEDKLIGYMAFNQKTGLVVDSFAGNVFDMGLILFHGLHFIRNYFIQHNLMPLSGFFLINNLIYRSILAPDTKQLSKYDFAFTCYILDESLPKESFQPSNWFIMPND